MAHRAPTRRRRAIAALVVAALAALTVVVARRTRARRTASGSPLSVRSRTGRTATVAAMGTRIVADTALTKARQVFADAPRREQLQRDLELRSAEQVADRLGNMKGALMKLGQMASYLDDGLPEHVRGALSVLQASAPPMSAELAADVVRTELGGHPAEVFAEWDPTPIAAASIGQVHRAITHDGRAVAVKVQYPGVADAIAADLGTADLVFAAVGVAFAGFDRGPVVAELRERITEELDYRAEARHQQRFAEFYAGHPFLHVPAVVTELSTARVLTTELATGATFDEVVSTWDDDERDLAGEALFRFVFRSLYRLQAFNGDPHPGNYLFNPGGRLTLLDFGLVRTFAPDELRTFESLIETMVLDHDPGAFRAAVERAGLLQADAPVDTDAVAEFFSHFYAIVRSPEPFTFTPEYASAIVRRTFDASSPIAPYATVPASFVLIQRINLGLYALLGSLRATRSWRCIAEELWPMVDGPPSTPLGVAEAAWLAKAPKPSAKAPN